MPIPINKSREVKAIIIFMHHFLLPLSTTPLSIGVTQQSGRVVDVVGEGGEGSGGEE